LCFKNRAGTATGTKDRDSSAASTGKMDPHWLLVKWTGTFAQTVIRSPSFRAGL